MSGLLAEYAVLEQPIIEPGDLMPSIQQHGGQHGTDVTFVTCQQNSHECSLLRLVHLRLARSHVRNRPKIWDSARLIVRLAPVVRRSFQKGRSSSQDVNR